MCKGAADTWAHNFIDKALEHDLVNWGTWENFEKELKFTFANPDKKNSARQVGKALPEKFDGGRVLLIVWYPVKVGRVWHGPQSLPD